MRTRYVFVVLICFCVFAAGCKKVEENVTLAESKSVFDGVELENGLKIYHRYLTDSELEGMKVPEITFKHFENFRHQCVIAGKLLEIPLKKDYGYKSRGMTVENDKSGRQWVHFFIDSAEKYIQENEYKPMNARSKFTLMGRYPVKKCFEEFSFILDASDREQAKFGFANFGLKLPGASISMIDLFFDKGKLYAKFRDMSENISLEKLTNSNAVSTENFYLGDYAFGTEEKIRMECTDRKMTVTYRGNSKSYTYSELIPENILGFFNAGITPYNKDDVFVEMLVSDLEIEFGE